MATPAEFISILHQSHTQSKVWHHQTDSFAVHDALGTYYDEIVDLVDGLVESTEGISPRIIGYQTKPILDYVDCDTVVLYFKGLFEYIDTERKTIFPYSFQQNQIDEITKLVAQTLFRLSLNKY